MANANSKYAPKLRKFERPGTTNRSEHVGNGYQAAGTRRARLFARINNADDYKSAIPCLAAATAYIAISDKSRALTLPRD